MDLDKLRKQDIEVDKKEFDSITKEVEEFIQQVAIGMQIPKEYLKFPEPPKVS